MRILLQSAPDKFDATLVELRKLVAVPDEIASEIREAHSAQYDKTNEHAQKKRQTTTIKNPYKKPPPPNPFTIAAGDAKVIDKNAKTNNSGHGRAKGSKNKTAHKAGGNRKDSRYVKVGRDQPRMAAFLDNKDSDSDIAMDTAEEDLANQRELERKEELAKRDAEAHKQALEDLHTYVERIPGGSSTMPGSAGSFFWLRLG